MGWGALGAAGLSLGLGAANASKARKSQRHATRRFLDTIDAAQLFNLGRFGQAKQLLGENKDLLGGAFDAAKAETSRSFRGAQQQVLDREQQALGANTAYQQQRGFGNSSALQNAASGIQMRTNRVLLDIGDLLAGKMAGLEIGKGQALAGVNTDLAQVLGQEAGLNTGLYQQRASFFGGQSFAPSSVNLGGLGSALDQLLAQYGIGQGGGGGGLGSLPG